jgi:mRNA interferase MazF
MARVLRGDVRWADLGATRGSEQAGQRPVLVLSLDVFNERSGTVIAVALTSQEPRAGFPLTLESHATGLPKRSWIKISQIRTLVVVDMHMHVRHIFGMRTTVELSDAVRARLLELAARRGERGFSALVEEALERYLEDEDRRRRQAEDAKAVIGILGEREADELEASVRTLRERWR